MTTERRHYGPKFEARILKPMFVKYHISRYRRFQSIYMYIYWDNDYYGRPHCVGIPTKHFMMLKQWFKMTKDT